MGGQAGGRGYLLQSLICVLEIARRSDNWQTVTLEPDAENEKVDFCLVTSETTSITQVKSSQNTIALPDVEGWAKALEASLKADHYELLLIGPCSVQVSKTREVGKVRIPLPSPLNIKSLIEQASHRLDAYFETKGISRVPPFARELLISALVTKFSTFATNGTPLSRLDLDKLLYEWVLELYPQSITTAVEMQCTVLWDLIVFTEPEQDLSSTQFITKIVIRNDGVRTAIIDDLVVVVSKDGVSMQFGPTMLVDIEAMTLKGRPFTMNEAKGLFMEFAIAKGETIVLSCVFVHKKNLEQPISIPTHAGNFTFDIYALFSDKDLPVLLKSKRLHLKGSLQELFGGRGQNGGNLVARFERRKFDL